MLGSWNFPWSLEFFFGWGMPTSSKSFHQNAKSWRPAETWPSCGWPGVRGGQWKTFFFLIPMVFGQCMYMYIYIYIWMVDRDALSQSCVCCSVFMTWQWSDPWSVKQVVPKISQRYVFSRLCFDILRCSLMNQWWVLSCTLSCCQREFQEAHCTGEPYKIARCQVPQHIFPCSMA